MGIQSILQHKGAVTQSALKWPVMFVHQLVILHALLSREPLPAKSTPPLSSAHLVRIPDLFALNQSATPLVSSQRIPARKRFVASIALMPSLNSVRGKVSEHPPATEEVAAVVAVDEEEEERQSRRGMREEVLDLIANSIALVEDTKMAPNTVSARESAGDDFKAEVGATKTSTSRPSPPMEPVEYEEDAENEQNGVDPFGSPFFSRVHSPPPRHRGSSQEEAPLSADKAVHDDFAMYLNEEEQRRGQHGHEWNDENVNEHHYYNARYPPRRGRYGRNVEQCGNGKGPYYRPKGQHQYHRNSPTPKMEWKRKEKKVGNSSLERVNRRHIAVHHGGH